MGFTQRFSARMLRPYCHDCLGGCYNSDATGFDITEKDVREASAQQNRAPAIPLFAYQNFL
jgi:hypothetical protein